MPRLMIQLRKDAAEQIHSKGVAAPGNPDISKLMKALSKLGVTLFPVHPGQTHPSLVNQFMVETTDKKSAEEIIQRIQRMKIVEGAYIQPDPELP